MVPTLPFTVSNFAVPTLEYPMGFNPRGRLAGLNGYGLRVGFSPATDANQDCRRRSGVRLLPVSAMESAADTGAGTSIAVPRSMVHSPRAHGRSPCLT